MNILNFIKNNLLIKVTSANALLVMVRMIFSLISQKVLAIVIGAEGIAQVGNFRNVLSFFEQFSILGTSNGLVKYISEFKDNNKKLNDLFSTSIVFASFAAIVSFIVLFFYSNVINNIIFGSEKDYAYIFKILAFIVPFMAINANLNALINGISDYKIYSKVTFSTVIVSAFLIVFLTIKHKINGSIIAITLIPIIQFFIIYLFISKPFTRYINIKKFNLKLVFKNELLSYTIMSVIVIFSINYVDVAVRNLIEKNVSIVEAGYWTAMGSISKTYMQFSSAIFPLYILPRFAKITNTYDFKSEIKKIYKMLLPLIIVGMILVFLFKNLIIRTLYTDDFLSMSGLFKWQLLGDLVKFIALVIAYQFLAKKQIVYFIFTEILSVALFYFFSVYLIDIYGTEGVVMAHLVRYILYLLVVLYILRHSFIGENRDL